MKRLLHTPLALLVWRIALLYAALMLCRAAFWVYNAALLGPPEWSELGQLVAGSLKFDTASVVYADGVFILLSLLPLHLREQRWYRGMLFWYYVIVNAVLIAAANLATSVTRRNVSRPTKFSSPTTTTRCSWPESSWPKTGISCCCGRDSWPFCRGVTAAGCARRAF